jgi:hypothetical protein
MEWVTEWNNTNDIPPGVRVSMVVGAGVEINGGQSAEWSAVREFYLPSHMVPVALERGGAGGFGGPPGGGLQPPPINVPGRNPQ